ncbi:ATP-binding cassette domain-containing protein [Actinoplanes couchii]|uniref:ABC transporter n=1 Tax=Actinoplanes couchii TaxID=403638 RepID=A0ABQ3XM50_9ACTN|nr:ABC transporter ATP-binding protein [Actinoplanes couchii]MDR6319294.1 ABC-2 type transport system ATP-binding protein [Actinoplanes couchii]GID59497.1 ABC transporter [Actinoplanes couchii]
MIATNALQVRYGDTIAVHDLDLELAAGRIYGLLGRNGAGKTSLLSTLAGFRKPSAGTVTLDGRPVFETLESTSRICLIGDDGAVGDGTDRLRDILDMAATLRPGFDTGYAAHLMDRFALDRKKTLGALSRGQRSAFGVVAGLASRAALTMFDEAHLGMDAPTRQLFADELLADYGAHPRTFLLSTHLIEEQSPLFEQVLILHEGRLLWRGDVDDLRSRGIAVTGPASVVDDFVYGLTVLAERALGPTKQVTLYGDLDDEHRKLAARYGLELGPVALQDLFIHLTGGVP